MSFETCRRICAQNSKSFYFASFPLPKEKRNATYATYAFCRTADDIADEATPETANEARQRLSDLRALLASIEKGERPDHELWGPLADSVVSFKIPVEPLRILLDGVESDLTPRGFRTFTELKDYCFKVASTVGLALSHIFGFESNQALDYAANMGIAMQLTNIVRDVGGDLRLGRIYLPSAELERFGYSEEKLRRGVIDDAFVAMMQFQISRAREFYRRAFQGIRYLTRDGSHWTAFLMGDVYRGILDEVERNDYDVFTRRAVVSFGRKVRLATTAPLRFRREVILETAPIVPLLELE